MDKQKHLIIGVHITDRVQHAGRVQQLLTEFGCFIKTRLGLHEATKQVCSPEGIILLEIAGNHDEGMKLVDKLNEVEGVEAQTMIFDHV